VLDKSRCLPPKEGQNQTRQITPASRSTVLEAHDTLSQNKLKVPVLRAQHGLSTLAFAPARLRHTSHLWVQQSRARQISPIAIQLSHFIFPHSSLEFGTLPRHLSGGEPLNTRSNHKASATSRRRNTPSPNILGDRDSSQDVSKTGKGNTCPTRPNTLCESD